MLADVLAIAGEIGARRGALGDAYVAMLLSWVWRAKDGNPIVSTCEVHLPTTLKTMADAVDPARKASAFTWSTADSILSDRRGAGALARLAGAARHGDLRTAAMAALDYLRARYAGSPDHAEALIAEGMDRLHKAGDPEGAAVVAWSLVASVPANWPGHDLLGHCSERLGDPEAALRHALAALECSPSHGGLQARVGCVLMYLLSRPADAEPYLRNGTRLWPDARAWHWHAEALARINRVPEALVAIEEALHRVPANPAYRALKNRLLSASVPPAADSADGTAI